MQAVCIVEIRQFQVLGRTKVIRNPWMHRCWAAFAVQVMLDSKSGLRQKYMLVGQLRDQRKKSELAWISYDLFKQLFPTARQSSDGCILSLSILFFAWVHSYYMHLLKVNRRHFTGTFGCPKSTSLGYGVRLVYFGKGSYCNIGKDDHTNIILPVVPHKAVAEVSE